MLDETFQIDEMETRQYQRWENTKAFMANPNQDAPSYAMMMPPPNITGNLHMGHALTFTLQDVLIRFHRMNGYDVLWQPGTDHAGIATQMLVEQQLIAQGVNRHDLNRDDFIAKVLAWQAHSDRAITAQLRRLGASPDWTRARFTMDEGLSHAVRKVFVRLYKQGLIYRAKRLVNWDPKLHTAISDLEVEPRTIVGTMWYFRYPVEGWSDQFLTVATTRPETMLGDTAVAIHPHDERYQPFIGKRCFLPIAGRSIPIITDPYVNPEKGSGAVKITPAHDFNDFSVACRHNLPMVNIFDRDACLNKNVPEVYRGLDRYVARDKLVAKMESLGLLEKAENLPIVIPYADRSGVVIEPWLTDQWFIDAKTLAGPAIRAVETGHIRFIPRHWENTYYDWMRNIQPWCISRQIWWGHQIPAWYGPDGQVFVEMTEREAAATAAAYYGQPVNLSRDDDVLDTWFSSALWPFSSLGWPERTRELARYYPTDVLVTGFDIIFFWVARMIMMGLHVMNDVPFRTVYIHALVRDEQGQKMSKSKGNVIDPLDLVGKYGCDALRFTLATQATSGRDVRMSEQRVIGYRNFVTKLRNTARFCTLHQCHPIPTFQPNSVENRLNTWIIAKLNKAGYKITDAIVNLRLNDAAQIIYSFTWNTFCDWYLEFSKLTLHSRDIAAIAETRATAAWVLDQVLILAHPFMPFITEELWYCQAPARSKLLISMSWPVFSDSVDYSTTAEMDFIVDLITQIRSVRSEMNIPVKVLIPVLVTSSNTQVQAWIGVHRELIATMVRAEWIKIIDDTHKPDSTGTIQIVVGEATILLKVIDTVNLEQEKTRLTREIQRLSAKIGRIDQKLKNTAFITRAQGKVVEETRIRHSDMIVTRNKLDQALQRIANATVTPIIKAID